MDFNRASTALMNVGVHLKESLTLLAHKRPSSSAVVVKCSKATLNLLLPVNRLLTRLCAQAVGSLARVHVEETPGNNNNDKDAARDSLTDRSSAFLGAPGGKLAGWVTFLISPRSMAARTNWSSLES